MRASFWLVAAFAWLFPGCSQPVDLTKGVQVVDISTGWRDAGVVNGQNKLVPSITFRVKNVSDQRLGILQVNAVFRRLNKGEDELGSRFMTVAGSEGLPPGASSQMLTMSSEHGYTGIEPEQQMLQNSQFIDAKVQLFAKYGSAYLARVAEIAVMRRLVGR